MNDLDNLLSSVGLNSASSETARPRRTVRRRVREQEVSEQPQQEEVQLEATHEEEQTETTALTDSDYCDILESVGVPCNLDSNEESEENEALAADAVDSEGRVYEIDTATAEELTRLREDVMNTFIETSNVALHQGNTDTPADIAVVQEAIDTYIASNGADASHTSTGEVAGVTFNSEEQQPEPVENTSTEETPVDASALPANSPTLLMNDTTARFSGAEWYNEIQRTNIILAGLGGIGSWTALQLARMVPSRMVLYDDDVVEAVNMAGQLYGYNDVGKNKVNAVSELITSYTSMQNVYAIPEKFTSECDAGDIMICGFDNMDARKTFFNSWEAHVMCTPEEERRKCLFIDGRLSMDELQVLCMSGEDSYNIMRYRNEFLFSSREAEHTVCSMKQTTYLASMIGSFIVNLFTNWVANLLNPIIPYDVPFFTNYNAQNMLLNFER